MRIPKAETPEQLKSRNMKYYIDSGGNKWINLNRGLTDHYIIKDLIKLSELMGIEYKVIPSMLRRMIEMTTIRPQTPVTETVANVSITDNYIYISFLETDDDFRGIIHDHDFSWGGFGVGWERKCTQFTGAPLDRATEICISLLKAGFVISISDDILKEKILKKEYEPEQKRWITKLSGGKYDGWFCVSYEYGSERMYKSSRAIAGSRWSKPSVLIPAYQYEAILDLADLHNFKLSPGAKELIEQARKTKEEALIVDMSETTEPVITEQPKKEEYGICASLRDDD